MYVEPEHRGKGINKAIIERLNEWALDRGIHEIRLQVLHENVAAQKAYEKIGFKGHMLEMRLGI